jgi:hypothetical protein
MWSCGVGCIRFASRAHWALSEGPTVARALAERHNHNETVSLPSPLLLLLLLLVLSYHIPLKFVIFIYGENREFDYI